MLSNTTTKTLDPISAGKCMSERLSTAMYGGAVHAPRTFAHSTHLSGLITLTYNAHMLLDTEPNINVPTAPLPTNAQLPTKHPWGMRPDEAMQPRDDKGMIARTRPPRSRILALLPHSTYPARTRKQTVAHHPRRQDTGKRQKKWKGTG
jgi:hypothetical protein